MVEFVVLAAFAALLVAGTVADIPLVVILCLGYVLFLGYGIATKHSVRTLLERSVESVATVKNVILLFVVIGALTAAWRASGTIPTIVAWSSRLLSPAACLVMCFLLCSLMSVLMGTGFGTVATMGVICMAIASAMGANRMLVGGAIIAGSYFGDRCSPVSSSALLVSTVTHTELSKNVSRMFRTGAVPFAITCGIYLALGLVRNTGGTAPDVADALNDTFSLGAVTVLPAVAIVVLSAARVEVKRSMLVSLALAVVIAVVSEGVSPAELPAILAFGYECNNPRIATMVSGGGILSMTNVMAVIAISSTYVGLFRETGLLRGACAVVTKLSRAYTPFVSVLATSVLSCGLACSQTLAILLTNELCDRSEKDASALAMDLENSVVIVSPLVPWSVSSVAALAAISAPVTSLAAACFLYLVPTWTLFVSLVIHRTPKLVESTPGRLLGLELCDVAGPKDITEFESAPSMRRAA